MKKTINAIIVTAGIAASAAVAADDFNTVVGIAEVQPVSAQVQVVNPNNIADLVERNIISAQEKLSESSANVAGSISEYAQTL